MKLRISKGLVWSGIQELNSLWLPRWFSGWRICLQCRRSRRRGFDPWVGEIPWRVHFSHSVLSNSANPGMPGLPVHHQLPEFTQTHVHRVGDAVQPSHPVVPFSSCPQSFPASGSFQMSQLFPSGSQSIGVSASTSVLAMNTQDWSPLGWTSWISLQSKGLSRVFSNTTVQKHQFFGTQLSLQSNSHIHTWPLEKP